MFSVIFEVLPNKENYDDYLDNAKMLRPELESRSRASSTISAIRA